MKFCSNIIFSFNFNIGANKLLVAQPVVFSLHFPVSPWVQFDFKNLQNFQPDLKKRQCPNTIKFLPNVIVPHRLRMILHQLREMRIQDKANNKMNTQNHYQLREMRIQDKANIKMNPQNPYLGSKFKIFMSKIHQWNKKIVTQTKQINL